MRDLDRESHRIENGKTATEIVMEHLREGVGASSRRRSKPLRETRKQFLKRIRNTLMSQAWRKDYRGR